MWKIREHDKEKETQLLDNGIDRLMARMLSSRNVAVEDVESFLEADYNSLADPNDFVGIKDGVEVFCDIVKNKKKIAIMGDYDADGVISTSMFYLLCKSLGVEPDVFLPNRMKHGYGLNKTTIEEFQNTHSESVPHLVVILDCGINNREEIEELKRFGVERVIIIDHHLYSDEKLSTNADALINWRLDENAEEMCTCGQVYQFIRAVGKLTRKVNPIEFLSYAAIGTVADCQPIYGDNRIIVRNGLSSYSFNHTVPSGLNAMLRKTRIYPENFCQEDVSFKIAPRINAAGRMEDPRIAYALLVEADTSMADLMADNLEEYNSVRKKEHRSMEQEAIKMVNEYDHPNGILLYRPNWHIGIVGIVASRIVETFNKPTLIFGNHNGVIKGSGRSLQGISISNILKDCSSIFEKFGGHDMAVGATLKSDRLDEANALFNEACRKYYISNSVEIDDTQYYDVELKAETVTPKLVKKLIETMYPYCSTNNPEPIFKLSDVTITDVNVIEGEGWQLLKFEVAKDDGQVFLPMKMFSTKHGSEIKYKTADIYIKLPQYLSGKIEASVVDIIIK